MPKLLAVILCCDITSKHNLNCIFAPFCTKSLKYKGATLLFRNVKLSTDIVYSNAYGISFSCSLNLSTLQRLVLGVQTIFLILFIYVLNLRRHLVIIRDVMKIQHCAILKIKIWLKISSNFCNLKNLSEKEISKADSSNF